MTSEFKNQELYWVLSPKEKQEFISMIADVLENSVENTAKYIEDIWNFNLPTYYRNLAFAILRDAVIEHSEWVYRKALTSKNITITLSRSVNPIVIDYTKG